MHIDGDHSYDGAAQDIADSLLEAKAHGVIIIDDYCHPNYLGVAAAAWEVAKSQKLFPFVATPQKFYCALNYADARAWQTTFLTKSPWRTLGQPGIHPDSENGVDNTTVYNNQIMIIPTSERRTSGLRVLAKRYLRGSLINLARIILRGDPRTG